MEEIFREIKDYPNYQVSNLGIVKSLNYGRGRKEKLLKPGINTSGYYFVNLYKSGIIKSFSIHQLVAMAFLNHQPLGYKLVVNHINFNRTDNRLENLEIVTARENSNRKHIKSSSRFVGVHFDKIKNKWRAYIYINGKIKYLGFFYSEIEASKYYESALLCINENRIKDIEINKPKFSSEYKGVSFHKSSNKWIARIVINRKRKLLGYFQNEIEAHYAYQNKLKEIINL